MSPTYVRYWRCGWVCQRQRRQVATFRIVVACTLLSNLHCIIIGSYDEQLAIAVGEEIPKKSYRSFELLPYNCDFQPVKHFFYIYCGPGMTRRPAERCVAVAWTCR